MPAGVPAYAYNASAIALGGIIRRGDLSTIIPTVGSVCLSPSGGEASITVDNYYRDDISFARAESRVSGGTAAAVDGGARRHITYANVYIRDLKIFDRIRIALMQATITSTREIGPPGCRPPMELAHDKTKFNVFLLYRGVEIDGVEVYPDVDADLCSAGTYSDFADRILERAPETLLSDEDGVTSTELTALKQERKPFVGALVKDIGNYVDKKAHKAKLPKFGNAKFGELLVKPDRQRFSLLRLELNSDWTGIQQPRRRFPFQPAPDGGELLAAADTFAADALSGGGDGEGGSLTSGGGGSNGIPVWP